MKLKTVRLDPAIVPTRDPVKLQCQHADLKEQLLRSAHTDHHTRGERDQMREVLARLSESHRSITGVSLK
ncbi:hypothetical protein IYR97_26125 (plasmid) [Pseudomonas fulva]|uniref:Uncharacterized protein n=3 Tax=Pseudomonas TaxID=286 RepID=A0A1X0ZH32_PSEPU|nr:MULTISPECIES: hypothetical protein [Pseudomonas]EKT4529990.1 hypothetical protein [Pseudomonas putida]MCT8162863.1 hypothetical protein [Pseudomonas sp. HD6422]MCT8181368.1 hypothetical protein [Pseudomonas sp. HD6421]MDH1929040.1 hypothetical protein [Pseudomonas sp. GD03696]MDM1711634.1 hypothetical protein [Pseudomonas sp. 165]